MDPIAFFDHLAANSVTSQSSLAETCSLSNEQDLMNEQQVTTRQSLETIKQDNFQEKWDHFVESYRVEKQGKRGKVEGRGGQFFLPVFKKKL